MSIFQYSGKREYSGSPWHAPMAIPSIRQSPPTPIFPNGECSGASVGGASSSTDRQAAEKGGPPLDPDEEPGSVIRLFSEGHSPRSKARPTTWIASRSTP